MQLPGDSVGVGVGSSVGSTKRKNGKSKIPTGPNVGADGGGGGLMSLFQRPGQEDDSASVRSTESNGSALSEEDGSSVLKDIRFFGMEDMAVLFENEFLGDENGRVDDDV